MFGADIKIVFSFWFYEEIYATQTGKKNPYNFGFKIT